MHGMEGASFGHKQERQGSEYEKTKDLVYGAFEQLTGEGRRVFDSLFEPGLPLDEFRHRVREFNNLPAEERGKGRYDHSRPLTEHVDLPEYPMTIPPGRPVTILLKKNGELIISFLG